MDALVRPPGGRANGANAINNRAQVVGFSLNASDLPRAVLCDDDTNSVAMSIDNHGQVAGASFTASGEQHAVLWTTRRSNN